MVEMWGSVAKVSFSNESYSGTFNGADYEINFNIPFDSDTTPNEVTAVIYNLSNGTISKMKKRSNMTITAGFKNNSGVVFSGKLARHQTVWNGTDKMTTFYMTEGVDYSEAVTKKAVTFKKGVVASTIIKKLASLMGASIHTLNLPKNKVYSKGYTIEDSLLDKLEEVANDCGAQVYWNRGKLLIRSIKSGNDDYIEYNENNGLIDTPAYFSDDTSKGYNARFLLQHNITTATRIKLTSRAVKGSFRVRQGTHSYDGSQFITEAELIY